MHESVYFKGSPELVRAAENKVGGGWRRMRRRRRRRASRKINLTGASAFIVVLFCAAARVFCWITGNGGKESPKMYNASLVDLLFYS